MRDLKTELFEEMKNTAKNYKIEVTAPTMADKLACGCSAVYKHLQLLVKEGKIELLKAASRDRGKGGKPALYK